MPLNALNLHTQYQKEEATQAGALTTRLCGREDKVTLLYIKYLVLPLSFSLLKITFLACLSCKQNT